jgi:hypothetical protein
VETEASPNENSESPVTSMNTAVYSPAVYDLSNTRVCGVCGVCGVRVCVRCVRCVRVPCQFTKGVE